MCYLEKSLNENDIVEFGSVLLADVFTSEVTGLVCSALYSHLYGIVPVLAIDGIYGSGQA